MITNNMNDACQPTPLQPALPALTPIEQSLRYQVGLQKVIAIISSNMIKLGPDQLDAGIDQALADLGAYIQADRCYLYLFNDSNTNLHIYKQWLAPSIPPEFRLPNQIATDLFPEVWPPLHRGEGWYIPSVENLPLAQSELKTQMQFWKISAAAFMPMICGQDTMGALGVDMVCGAKYWSEETIQAIKTVGEILANALSRERIEKELRQALEKEKELNELKTRFVSITSHEFRTPLSTILSSAELLEHYGHRWSEDKKREHLHRIQASVNVMNQLLTDVLILGKAQAGKLEFSPKTIDLPAFCEGLLEEFQLGRTTGQRVNFLITGQPAPVQADQQLLHQIILNLLSNAAKYSPSHQEIDLTLSFEQNDCVIFRVKDRGIGIPLEDHNLIFELFHRASNAGTTKGTGLGLAIVRKAVDLHQGQISLQSQPGQGSTFTVSIPRNTGG